jgi:hypothetical protein
MKIREGAYYRTRGGRVIGPMKHVDYRAEKWKFLAIGFHDCVPCWTDEGRWCEFGEHDMDLISEVYVSDTPPTLITVRTGSSSGGGGMTPDTQRVGFAPVTDAFPLVALTGTETKTLRDEFAMEAMKLLIPRHERREETLAEFAYRQADAMMEDGRAHV